VQTTGKKTEKVKINRRKLISVGAMSLVAGATGIPKIIPKRGYFRHVPVFGEKGLFASWPANGGIWSWGNEILVAFYLGYYKPDVDDHSVDFDRPRIVVLARSLDGGGHWTVDRHEHFANEKGIPSPGGINFAHPGFAMRYWMKNFYITYDRGKAWEGPFQFDDFAMKIDVTARSTDYLVLGKDDCQLFLSAKDTVVQAGVNQDRAFLARTTDGGKTFKFLSWMTDEPRAVRSAFSSTVRISDQELVTVLRRRVDPVGGPRNDINWIDAYGSNDNGKSWQFLRRVAYTDLSLRNGNPPSMVRLRDGRLCVTYGYRAFPYGIRAKVSNDNGKSWGREITLRDDGRTWDLGYARSVCRPDGKVLTVYYFTTAQNPEQHISATIWDPTELAD
jgi:hypothetical protein